jgi:DNA repair exonuclease SbcCD ATPase subunit
MENRVTSIETQLALMQQDINSLRTKTSELPPWLRKSALGMIGIMLLQIASTIWWAAELTTNQKNMEKEISLNTAFRMEFPKMHEEVMLELKEIKVNNNYTQSILGEIKDKLKYLDTQL